MSVQPVVKGLRFTSPHAFTFSPSGENTKEGGAGLSVFDCGAVLDPFYSGDKSQWEHGRSPVLCTRCASYLSTYATVNKLTGEWVCSICSAVNPRFHQAYQTMQVAITHNANAPSSRPFGPHYTSNNNDLREAQLREMYAELRGPHCGFTEDLHSGAVYATSSAGASTSEKIAGSVIFAIDSDLCGDAHAVSLLCEGIVRLPGAAEVSILVFGRHISALRLGSGLISNAHPIAADIFPGNADRSSLFTHLIQRRTYSVRAAILKGHLDVLRCGVVNLATTSDTAPHLSNTAECTVDAIVGLAVALNAARTASETDLGRAGNVIVLTDRILCCASDTAITTSIANGSNKAKSTGSDAVVGQLMGAYTATGKWALANNCHVDVLHASLRSSNLDQLDALVSPSGGTVISGNGYEEHNVRQSLLQLVARLDNTSRDTSTADICYSRLSTLEIRTCGKLAVDRIIGPIVASDDVVQHNAQACTAMGAGATSTKVGRSICDGSQLTYQAAELALDNTHLAHSLHFQDLQAGSFVAPTDSSKSSEAAYEQLVKRNQQFVVLSGINMRQCPTNDLSATQDCITVQFKASTGDGSAKVNSPYSIGNVIIGTVADSAAERDRVHAAQSLHEDVAYVQFVVRYVEHGSTGLSKVTRVWTQRLALTSSKEEYLAGLDAPLWSYIVSRGLVADYHVDCARAFGGARRYKLDEQGQYLFSALKTSAVSGVDALVKAVAQQWPLTGTIRSKAQAACRLLYQLREGPLLDGPAADPMEAYLLRSLFLKSSFAYASRIVQPSLQLAVLEAVRGVSDTTAADALIKAFPPPSLPPPTSSSSTPASVVAASSAASVPLAASALQMMYPPPAMPPSSTAPSATPTFAPPPGPSPGPPPGPPAFREITSLFPPPPTPPPGSIPITTGGTVVAMTQMYSPPAGPPPSNLPTAKLVTPAVPAPHASTIMLDVPADSTSLLPNTVAVLDCGDHIIIRRNGPATPTDAYAGSLTDLDASTQLEALLKTVEREVHTTAGGRYPVPSVYVLSKPGTPQDRMLYCRLSPAHMDAKESIFAALTAELQSHLHTFASQNGGIHAQNHHQEVQALLRDLTSQSVDSIVAPAPFTEQLFFAKYLTQMVPAQAAALLAKSAPAAEEFRKTAPISQSMDRGPPSVFTPPPGSGSASRSNTLSSDASLPF